MHTHNILLPIHLIQFLIVHIFRIPNQTLPTHYSRAQNMELCLIPLPCHIDANPFISHVELIPTCHFNFMNHLIQSSCSHHVKAHNHNSYITSFTKVIQFINLKEYTYKHVVHF